MELPNRRVLKHSAVVISAVIVVGVLFAHNSLDASDSVQKTIEVETNLTDEDVRIYDDERKVSYVWGWSNPRGEPKQLKYKNISLDRYTARETTYIAEERILEELESEFGEESTEHIQTNIEQGEGYHFGINVTYDRHFNHPFSYEGFKETVPDQVKGTLHYKNQTNTATLPVFTTAVGTERDYNYSVENFDSSYQILDGTGAKVHIGENYSSLDSYSGVLTLSIDHHKSLMAELHRYRENPEESNPITVSSSKEETLNTLEDSDYIEHRGTYYNITYEPPKTPPQNEVIFDTKLFSKNVTPESPATIQLSLEVNTSQNITVTATEPYPFQLLEASSGDQELCLGSDAYKNATNIADNYCTGSMARNGTFATATRTQQPGDQIKRNYTINYQNIRETGNYNIEDSIRYQPKENGDERTLEYEIMFDLTKSGNTLIP